MLSVYNNNNNKKKNIPSSHDLSDSPSDGLALWWRGLFVICCPNVGVWYAVIIDPLPPRLGVKKVMLGGVLGLLFVGIGAIKYIILWFVCCLGSCVWSTEYGDMYIVIGWWNADNFPSSVSFGMDVSTLICGAGRLSIVCNGIMSSCCWFSLAHCCKI